MTAKKATLITIAAILVLILGGVGGYFWGQYQKSQDLDRAVKAADDAAVVAIAKVKDDAKKDIAMGQVKAATETTCNVDELSLSSSAADGAAGTISYNIVLTNVGKRACILGGFPGVSLVNDNGNQIGSSAERAKNYEEKKLPLAPGVKVKAIASISNLGNFPAGTCKEGATKLRVYPPNDTGYLSVATTITAWCPGFAISPVLGM